MGRAFKWLGMIGVAVVTFAARADATCICGDIDGCGSAPQCAGSVPGLDCTPPTGGTCHLVKGLPNADYCCCGCSKRAGAVGVCAAKYAGLADGLAAVRPELVKCTPPELEKPADKAVTNAGKLITKADKACELGNTKKEKAAAAASGSALEKLKKKAEKAEKAGKLAPGCAQKYADAIDKYVVDATDTANATTSTTTTTNTTTTTVAGGRALTVNDAFATASSGQLSSGDVVCLSRITGGCVATPGMCPALHLHAAAGTITIDASGTPKGPFTDPQLTGQHCGYGLVSTTPACGADSLPSCP